MRELLARLGADELLCWQAVWELDPWGEERADLRNALLCATIARALGAKDVKLEAFMPDIGGLRKKRSRAIDLTQMSQREVRQMARAIHASISGKGDEAEDDDGPDEPARPPGRTLAGE